MTNFTNNDAHLLLTFALRIDLIDVLDLVRLGGEVAEGGQVATGAAIAKLSEYADAHMHDGPIGSGTVRDQWFDVLSALHFWKLDSYEEPDRHGFRCDNRLDAIAKLKAAGWNDRTLDSAHGSAR